MNARLGYPTFMKSIAICCITLVHHCVKRLEEERPLSDTTILRY